jgi:hypothetical protein
MFGTHKKNPNKKEKRKQIYIPSPQPLLNTRIWQDGPHTLHSHPNSPQHQQFFINKKKK